MGAVDWAETTDMKRDGGRASSDVSWNDHTRPKLEEECKEH